MKALQPIRAALFLALSSLFAANFSGCILLYRFEAMQEEGHFCAPKVYPSVRLYWDFPEFIAGHSSLPVWLLYPFFIVPFSVDFAVDTVMLPFDFCYSEKIKEDKVFWEDALMRNDTSQSKWMYHFHFSYVGKRLCENTVRQDIKESRKVASEIAENGTLEYGESYHYKVSSEMLDLLLDVGVDPRLLGEHPNASEQVKVADREKGEQVAREIRRNR
ncbi:MAG: YceK/YidQ family lipoprotein [Puniceicoccales bacterium]|jgi:hypothetical protein|nr:YceK/YidQ family lipoprotein [Puniceicoccales bacterium]